MQLIPSEVAIGGVYFPPLLIASVSGVVAAWLTTRLLEAYPKGLLPRPGAVITGQRRS